MSERTLYDKVWDSHTVTTLSTGQTQLFIGLHLVHEVTTPQAFDMMRERGLSIAYPERTFATADHIIPTDTQVRPFADEQATAGKAVPEIVDAQVLDAGAVENAMPRSVEIGDVSAALESA